MSYLPPAPRPAPDHSKRFLNLSAGALIAVVTGILLVCCIGPIALCLFSPILASITDVAKTKPDVAITSCAVESGGTSLARVGLRVTNKGSSTESYSVKVEVRDSTGARVGNGFAYVSSVAPGGSANDEALVYLDATGGSTCHVVEVS